MTAKTEPAGAEVLAVPLPANDANAATVRDYLVALVREVWREDECFSGKRPFGNSGWQHEVYVGLAQAGLIESTRDKWDELEYDTDVADQLIQRAIAALGASS
jgi:hypothetical protein